MVVRKRNYAIQKLDVTKRVTLPNGRTFVARYERINRRDLPGNIRMRRTYRQRAAPRNRRRNARSALRGRGIISTLKKAVKHPLVKVLAKKDIEYAPGIYQNLTKRVKNKTLSRILNSDAAHLGLSKAIKFAEKRLNADD